MSELSKRTEGVLIPGDLVTYTDPQGYEHQALVTAYWGGEQPNGAVNLVYVSSDEAKRDPNGRQIERDTSVSHRSNTTAPGRFYT